MSTGSKHADLTIFAKHPHGVDPDALKDIKVVRTVVAGKTVHSLV